MIRVSLIVSVLFAVTIALILVQPNKPRRSADLVTPSFADVTRADTELSSLAILTPVPAEPETVAPASDTQRIARPKEAPARIEVPKSLVTAAGQVDTALLLATLSEPAHAAPEIQTYIVTRGDSLASIAYHSYGRTNRQADILSANRETLADADADADKLTAGQVLTIPNL